MSILVRADGNCGTILIRQTDRRNALSRDMLSNLSQAFEDLYQEASVRAVMVTGHGDHFTAGTDLYELQSSLDDERRESIWFEDAERQRQLLTQMLQYPKPIIAAVNGPALGLGIGLVAACDFVIASANASFGFPESTRGLSPGVSIPMLAHRIGVAATNRLLMRYEPIAAEEAYRAGLVHELVPFDFLWARAVQIANEMEDGSAVSISMSKRILNETVGEGLLTQLASAAAATATARTTDHAAEGIAAFVEKRKPKF